jgi:hypothetical protein
VPLQFFNCRQLGNTIPLIACQYHDVKINIEIESLDKLLVTSGFTNSAALELGISSTLDANLVCEMVLLDTDERRRFAQNSHEQLVDQVQWTGSDNIDQGTNRVALNFNHPVKEMMWIVRLGRFLNSQGTFKFLAYHPSDVDNMRLIATKRYVLSLARYTGGNRLILSNNLLVPSTQLQGALYQKFVNIQAAAITTEPVIDNITIMGDLLTLAEISQTVDEIFTGLTRTNVGDGAPNLDVVVRQPNNYGLNIDGSGSSIDTVTIQFNGIDRISRDSFYFNTVHPNACHTRSPPDGLHVYSFALSPEEFQPSGTCNFSRLDTAVLSLNVANNPDLSDQALFQLLGSDSRIDVMAYNYNVLRVMSGMAGLAFSN